MPYRPKSGQTSLQSVFGGPEHVFCGSASQKMRSRQAGRRPSRHNRGRTPFLGNLKIPEICRLRSPLAVDSFGEFNRHAACTHQRRDHISAKQQPTNLAGFPNHGDHSNRGGSEQWQNCRQSSLRSRGRRVARNDRPNFREIRAARQQRSYDARLTDDPRKASSFVRGHQHITVAHNQSLSRFPQTGRFRQYVCLPHSHQIRYN